ncbi:DoxX family protein [Acidiferrimicrobium sp. IK]|uniref:DoxX family protein n=1 Tax=Acidiferrimicrobium sp. IK TaxID=2871700 RepID=UPI0021CB19C5|nr:DoxX family protein [Acidiferrimicrobium sp. IK]MCU4186950.1 DoxX family protein [Acidiferrimicrobium sp. IK]
MAKAKAGRTGIDLPALMLRLTVGPMMVIHGLNKVRGPGGLEGTASYFESLGLQPAAVHARVAAGTEIGTGAMLTLGAGTPWAAAGVIGVMTSAAATDHKGKGFFIFKGGWEYVGIVGAVAATIAALGPGRFSVDRVRGKDKGGLLRALLASALGIGSALGVLTVGRRPSDTAS